MRIANSFRRGGSELLKRMYSPIRCTRSVSCGLRSNALNGPRTPPRGPPAISSYTLRCPSAPTLSCQAKPAPRPTRQDMLSYRPPLGTQYMATFTKVTLYTDRDGRAKWREEEVPLTEGTPQAMLSAVFPSAGYQLRHSPVGFRSPWHCTPKPQWVFILGGGMEIGLQDGSLRVFKAGEHFFSADVLPEGTSFNSKVHGHWSAQRGDRPLVTLFVKV